MFLQSLDFNRKFFKMNKIYKKTRTIDVIEDNDVNSLSESEEENVRSNEISNKFRKNSDRLIKFLRLNNKPNRKEDICNLTIGLNPVKVKNGNINTIETLLIDKNAISNNAFSNKVKNVCLIEESPFYIHKVRNKLIS